MYSDIVSRENLDNICYIEFSISKGDPMRWWLNKNENEKSSFFGFDTFEGIPEVWGTKPVGSYTRLCFAESRKKVDQYHQAFQAADQLNVERKRSGTRSRFFFNFLSGLYPFY